MKKIRFLLFWWLTIPHLICFLFSPEKKKIMHDINRWNHCLNTPFSKKTAAGKGWLKSLSWLLVNFVEFRNLYYVRMGKLKTFLMYLPKEPSLHIYTESKNLGAGVFIQHGCSTIITAEYIGEDCWINQQVTIGYNNSRTRGFGMPWIGANVRVSAGAKVCGPVKIGEGSTIGLNAVVVKDVPENSVVIPSSMMIRRAGDNVFSKF